MATFWATVGNFELLFISISGHTDHNFKTEKFEPIVGKNSDFKGVQSIRVHFTDTMR